MKPNPTPAPSAKSSEPMKPRPLNLSPIRNPTQEEWDAAMKARDEDLSAKAPRDKDGKPVLTTFSPNEL